MGFGRGTPGPKETLRATNWGSPCRGRALDRGVWFIDGIDNCHAGDKRVDADERGGADERGERGQRGADNERGEHHRSVSVSNV